MATLRRFRHNLTKTPLRRPLYWFYHNGLRSTDVFIASYPRSGSTWLRFLLCEILTGQPTEFETLNRTIPRAGRHLAAPHLLPGGGRLIQTHEQYREEYRKAIYLVRDVRDVVISEYFHQRGQGLFLEDFDRFVEQFLRGQVNGYGPWQANVNSWVDAAENTSDILVVKFEGLRQRTKDTLAEILEFLGSSVEKATIQAAIKNNSVEAMRQKEARARKTVFKAWKEDSNFVRAGSTGGWRNTLHTKHLSLIESYTGSTLLRLGYQLSEQVLSETCV